MVHIISAFLIKLFLFLLPTMINFYKWLMNVRKKTLQMKDFYIFISHIDYNCQSLLVLLIFQINETSVLSKPT